MSDNTKKKRGELREPILKAVEVCGVLLGAVSFGALVFGFASSMSSRNKVIENFKYTEEYVQLCENKYSDLLAEVNEGKMTTQEAGEELKNFTSDLNVMEIIYNSENFVAKECLAEAKNQWIATGCLSVPLAVGVGAAGTAFLLLGSDEDKKEQKSEHELVFKL